MPRANAAGARSEADAITGAIDREPVRLSGAAGVNLLEVSFRSEGELHPRYASAGAAGADLLASHHASIAPGERRLVGTGLHIALPSGFEAQVRPRSGIAWRHGVTVLNAPGTIDADYRGEIMVMLINHGTDVFRINRGDRIAQLVIAPVVHARFTMRDRLPASQRAEGGFGSTGA